jgi:hypothetical protein
MGIYVEDGAVCWCWDGALLSMGATAAMRSAIAAALFPDYPNLYRSWDWNDSFPDHATMLADLDGRIRKYEESDDG